MTVVDTVLLGGILAVVASVAYGGSDFAAGVGARRVPVTAIAWWGHVLGTSLLLALASAISGAPPAASLLFGGLAGIVAGLGLLLFYGALARGQVSVITPLGASGVVVPVAIGIVRGESPGVAGWIGLVVIAVGILVLALTKSDMTAEPTPPCVGARPGCPEEQSRTSPRLPPVLAALLAAVSFGIAFVLVDAGAAGGEPLWTSAGLQAGGLLALVPVVLAGRVRRLVVRRRDIPVLLPAGLLAAGGDVALSLALDLGQLGTVSVLGSLDAVVSVLLAQLFLHERLGRLRAGAVGAAVAGGVLLALG